MPSELGSKVDLIVESYIQNYRNDPTHAFADAEVHSMLRQEGLVVLRGEWRLLNFELILKTRENEIPFYLLYSMSPKRVKEAALPRSSSASLLILCRKNWRGKLTDIEGYNLSSDISTSDLIQASLV